MAKHVKFEIIKDIEIESPRQHLADIPFFIDGINYIPPGYEEEYLLLSTKVVDVDKLVNEDIILKVTYFSVVNELKVYPSLKKCTTLLTDKNEMFDFFLEHRKGPLHKTVKIILE